MLVRLSTLDRDSGIADLAKLLLPIDGLGAIPKTLLNRVRRGWQAKPHELLQAGLMSSAAVLSAVLPRWTATVFAAAEDDLALAHLLAEQQRALGKGRSWREPLDISQRPWVRPLMAPSACYEYPARQAVQEMLAAVWQRFPELVCEPRVCREVATLLRWSGVEAYPCPDPLSIGDLLKLPLAWLVGVIRDSLEASRGTLYARYYDLPDPTLWSAEEAGHTCLQGHPLWFWCRDRAKRRSGETPQDREIVEELQVVLGSGHWFLHHTLAPRVSSLGCCHRLVATVLADLRTLRPRRYMKRQRHKRVARAWRQLLFFLSGLGEQNVEHFCLHDHAVVGDDPPATVLRAELGAILSEACPSRVPVGWNLDHPLARLD